MKKLVAIFGIFLVTACAQYTTSDKERAGLSATLESKTESYLQCIRDESRSLLDISSDVAFIADRAKVACDSQLEGFKAAQTELL